jgi:hypothetical protein
MFQFILSDILIYIYIFIFVYIGKVVLHVVTLPVLFPLKGTDPWPGSRSRNRWLVEDPLRCRIPRRKNRKMVRRNTGRSGGFMRDIKPIT